MRRPVVGSLYCGAGGLDLGFSWAGFAHAWAVDSDSNAVETFRNRVSETAQQLTIGTDPTPSMNVDVLIGGPPCQGFSVAGNMKADDPRSEQVFFFMGEVARRKPAAFVMENVPSVATNVRWRPVLRQLLDLARNAGYRTEVFVLNASDFGVSQARKRMFMIGVSADAASFEIPPIRSTVHTESVRSALEGLPRFGEPGNSTGGLAAVVPAKKPVLRKSAFAGMLFNGKGRVIDLDGLCPTLPASMGGNRSPIVDQKWLDDRGSAPWVVDYHRRLVAGDPPTTVRPTALRRLTVEEATVLQGFPASWRFAGPVSSQYRQIGNSVPPPLAEAVARSVYVAVTGDRAEYDAAARLGPTETGQLHLPA